MSGWAARRRDPARNPGRDLATAHAQIGPEMSHTAGPLTAAAVSLLAFALLLKPLRSLAPRRGRRLTGRI